MALLARVSVTLAAAAAVTGLVPAPGLAVVRSYRVAGLASVDDVPAGWKSALAAETRLTRPEGMAIAASGALYVADAGANEVLRIDAGGQVRVFAGTGTAGFSGDGGPAARAQLKNPTGVLPLAGGLLVVDSGNNRIRFVTPGGAIVTAVGNGRAASDGDGGPALAAAINPSISVGLVADGLGGFIFADAGGSTVRRVSREGEISTVAGRAGMLGYAGDGGPATQAILHNPSSVSLSPTRGLLIADVGNQRIRAVDPSGRISTVAGEGDAMNVPPPSGCCRDDAPGPALRPVFLNPVGVTALTEGNFLVADRLNHDVRRVDSEGTIYPVFRASLHGLSGPEVGPDGPISVVSVRGGMFVSERAEVVFVKLGRTAVLALSLSSARLSGARVRIAARVTRRARARVTVFRGKQKVMTAARRLPLGASDVTLRLPRRAARSGQLRVRVEARVGSRRTAQWLRVRR